jgi:hypothetical protein
LPSSNSGAVCATTVTVAPFASPATSLFS